MVVDAVDRHRALRRVHAEDAARERGGHLVRQVAGVHLLQHADAPVGVDDTEGDHVRGRVPQTLRGGDRGGHDERHGAVAHLDR